MRKDQETFQVRGSVFVATRGGISYKLALIPITVIPVKKFEALRKDYQNQLMRAVDEARKQLAVLYGAEETALDALKTAENSYEKENSEVRKLLDDFERDFGKRQGITVIESMNTVVINRNGNPDAEQVIERANMIQRATIRRKEAAEKTDTFRASYEGSHRESEMMAERLKGSFTDIVAPFFELLKETCGVSTYSNADGEFSIRVPRDSDVAITAFGSRTVGETEEKYFWKKVVGEKERRSDNAVFLANNELIESSGILDSDDMRRLLRGLAPPSRHFLMVRRDLFDVQVRD